MERLGDRMKLTIVGWYGTETIGDRAILLGLIDIFSEIDVNLEVSIGSLYPFYTERALIEDSEFVKEINSKCIANCFDVRNKSIAKTVICNSDMVIMGGGPLTEIYELDYIQSCFELAKKNEIKTGLIGVGIGPLNRKSFIRKIGKIIKKSDIIITRDRYSMNFIRDIFHYTGVLFFSKDPASLPTFKDIPYNPGYKDFIVVNLRKYPFGGAEEKEKINNYLKNLICGLLQKTDKNILLLSNHYFFLGGDDREYYYELKENFPNCRVKIQKESLSVKEVLSITKSADFCIGMRYHTVLFQTYLNGNNYILDYTDPNIGKTINFINDLEGGLEFYSNRYVNLLSDDIKDLDINTVQKVYKIKTTEYEETKKTYVKAINQIIDGIKNE